MVFLFKDVGSTRRTLRSLGVRITLAIALMATTVYGFLTGQLEIGAPWDARKYEAMPDATQNPNAGTGAQLDDVNKEK